MARDLSTNLIVKAISEGFDKIKADVSGLGDSVGKAGDGAKTSGLKWTELASAVNIAQTAFSAAMGSAKQLYAALKEGAQIEATRKTFDNLNVSIGETSDIMLGKMRDATRGMVSDFGLMQSANQFMSMGLATSSDEAAKLTEMAVQLGLAMGTDATTAMSDFAALLANQSIPRLDTFGISSGRVRTRIAELQEATKGLTREDAFLQAVLEEGAVAMGRVGDQSETTAGSLSIIESRMANVTDRMKENLAEASGPLLAKWIEMEDAVSKMSEVNQDLYNNLGYTVDRLNDVTIGTDQYQHSAGLTADEIDRLREAERGELVQIDKNRQAYEDTVKAMEGRREAMRREIEAGDDVEDSAIRIERAMNAAKETEADRTKRLQELAKAQEEAAKKAKELAAATGDYFSAAIEAKGKTLDMEEALYKAADAAGADAGTLALLGIATGQFSASQAEAALRTAALQIKIGELGAKIAEGMSIPDALDELANFREGLYQTGESLLADAQHVAYLRDQINSLQDKTIHVNVQVQGDTGDVVQGIGINNQMGGFVPGGRQVIVGEQGPELLTMRGAGGMITPAHNLNFGGITVNTAQGANGGQIAGDIMAGIAREVRRSTGSGAGLTGRAF